MRKRSGPTMWAVAVLSVGLSSLTAHAGGPSSSAQRLELDTTDVVSAATRPEAIDQPPAQSPATHTEAPPALPGPPTPVVVGAVPQALAAPPAPRTPSPGRTIAQQRERAWVFVGVGTGLFATLYLATGFAGALVWDEAKAQSPSYEFSTSSPRQKRRELAYGASLMVPVVGPFAGMVTSGSATRSFGLGISGVLQVASASLVIVGVRRLRRLNRKRRLAVGGSGSKSSAKVSLSVRF